MALLPNIRIDIASSFDGKGFKAASRSSNILTKQFRTLGSTVAAAMSARAILQFSAQSVKAFAEEDAAVTRLIKTFENLGLRYDGLAANDFISKLQSQVAVTEDELRPAMETLIRTTLDYGKAQDILNSALDISAGTGYDLQTVTKALSKAYLGQITTLARLNIGIGQAEAKTISFDDAMARLNDRFKGQAAAAVDTYAGKFKLLSIAANEAKEATGERMLTALQLLAKDQTIQGLTDDMQSFADKIGLASIGLADLLGKINRKIEIGGRTLGEILFAAAGGGFIDALAKRGGVVEQSFKPRPLGAPGAMQQQAKDAAIRKQQLEEQKRSIALQKKAAAEQAKTNRLKAISNTLLEKEKNFDLQRIQLAAALQGKLTAEQKLRVEQLMLIEDLKLAIAQRDLEQAEKLQKQLTQAQEDQRKLSESLSKFVANDPFTFWNTYWDRQTKERNELDGELKTVKAGDPFTAYPDAFSAQTAATSALDAKLKAVDAADPFTKWAATFKTQTDSTKTLDTDLKALEADDPFAQWNDYFKTQIDNVATLKSALEDLAKAKTTIVPESVTATDVATTTAAAETAATAIASITSSSAASDVATITSAAETAATAIASLTNELPNLLPDGFNLSGVDVLSGFQGVGTAPVNITVNVAGSVVADDDLAKTVLNEFYNIQDSGQVVSIGTNTIK